MGQSIPCLTISFKMSEINKNIHLLYVLNKKQINLFINIQVKK